MDTIGPLTAALAGRYDIIREIGRGGMATVYLARDVKHDRNVALKVLHAELGAVLGAERFLTEIRTTASGPMMRVFVSWTQALGAAK